jgi:hypothetical protein
MRSVPALGSRGAEMIGCVAFLGPSLPHAEARMVVGEECELRPPVKRGDLPSLPEDVALIAIIDGVFHGEAAVGHREILARLRNGTEVVGGGSMGALRAAELHSLGMKGMGEVFRLYAGGEIEGDDEVALIFDPEGLEALSEPLVNMRYNLGRAVEGGIIGEGERGEILERLRATFYPRRTIERLLEIAGELLEGASLSRFEILVREDYVDIKKEDALEVLRYVRMRSFESHTFP